MAAAAANMNTFEPVSDFVQEEHSDTLLLYLPGFTKEQLRVQLTRSGVLKISGTRPLGDNKWSSFQKDFPISANCDTNKITAKFEEGILYVNQPKLIVPAQKEENKIPPSKTPHSNKPTDESPPPKTNQEQATPQKATPDKPVQNKNENSTKDEPKSNESEGTKKHERHHTPEKTGKTDNDKHEKVPGKTDAELANKGTNRNDVPKVDGYKLDAGSPAAKLKMARQNMIMVLAVLFAFTLGIYISKLSWFSKKAEN